METSPANCLPEADSLPDGFVESTADPPPTAAAAFSPPPEIDYKDALLALDLDGGGRSSSSSPTEKVPGLESKVDALEVVSTSSDLLAQTGSGGLYDDSTARDGISSGGGGGERTGDSTEVLVSSEKLATDTSVGVNNQGDCRSSEGDAKSHLELSTSNLKESSEAKRKSTKRNTKSDKELLEFTLQYQKVLAERDAAVAVRERLESLCRELQRQNKILMDECQRVTTEGKNMRLDISTRFNEAIKDINKKLEEQKDECLTQLRENEMLRNNLKDLADQYSLSEQQFSHKLKQKTLELQIAELKLQQHEEKSVQEQTQMKLYAEQVSQLMATEKSLRLQLASDGERFQQFQDALTKSNEVFEAFKQEMEKMAKLIKDHKKENEFLKGKCEKSDVALVRLIEERELMKKQIEKVKNQKEKLESLCRSLQAERKGSAVSSIGNSAATQVDAPQEAS